MYARNASSASSNSSYTSYESSGKDSSTTVGTNGLGADLGTSDFLPKRKYGLVSISSPQFMH